MALNDKINTARSVLSDTKSRMIVIILVIIVVAVLGIAYLKFKKTQLPPAGLGSTLAGAPNITSIPGLGQPTREYAKLQEQQNLDLAIEAARKGTSAMPTVVRTTYVDSGVSSDLSKGSGAASTAGCGDQDLKRARASGVDVTELRCRGCSLAALKSAGFTAGELRNAGFDSKELKAAGFNAVELKNAGFDSKDLAAAGFTATELETAGFTGKCDLEKLKEARNKGAPIEELKEMGCSAGALKNAGYTIRELKEAGFNAGDLRDAGFSAAAVAGAGFTSDDLLAAGYSRGDLLRADVIADTAGSSEVQVNSCSAESLQKYHAMGKSASELKQMGCSSGALRGAGYTAAQLKGAGYTPEELQAVGFSPDDLKSAGFAMAEPKVVVDGEKAKLVSGGFDTDDNDGKMSAEEQANMGDQEKANFLKQLEAKLMMQANQLMPTWGMMPSQQYTKRQEEKVTHKGQAESPEAGAQRQKEMQLMNSDIYKAGSIILATLDTEVNSDENTPAMATVVHGPLKGAKVIGNFQRVEKKILLQFTVLSVPKLKNSIPINVVAVDPETSKTALASSVDNHYLSRYGTMLASGFVGGLGDAFSQAGSEISSTGSGETVKSMPALTTAQKSIVAVGTMAQQLNEQLAPKINRPPTVKVSAGTSIGLLIMADLAVPKN